MSESSDRISKSPEFPGHDTSMEVLAKWKEDLDAHDRREERRGALRPRGDKNELGLPKPPPAGSSSSSGTKKTGPGPSKGSKQPGKRTVAKKQLARGPGGKFLPKAVGDKGKGKELGQEVKGPDDMDVDVPEDDEEVVEEEEEVQAEPTTTLTMSELRELIRAGAEKVLEGERKQREKEEKAEKEKEEKEKLESDEAIAKAREEMEEAAKATKTTVDKKAVSPEVTASTSGDKEKAKDGVVQIAGCTVSKDGKTIIDGEGKGLTTYKWDKVQVCRHMLKKHATSLVECLGENRCVSCRKGGRDLKSNKETQHFDDQFSRCIFGDDKGCLCCKWKGRNADCRGANKAGALAPLAEHEKNTAAAAALAARASTPPRFPVFGGIGSPTRPLAPPAAATLAFEQTTHDVAKKVQAAGAWLEKVQQEWADLGKSDEGQEDWNGLAEKFPKASALLAEANEIITHLDGAALTGLGRELEQGVTKVKAERETALPATPTRTRAGWASRPFGTGFGAPSS
ncbi:hypothetical protein HD553DRAFT_325080 [Filobasidium floriforme]|uniref:uncharacterized protein n=1 Tax=Filobasidium floriforme TaxID=5210 RepID=UPI001E8E348B|nr:uncharacterized protein HD553DRAFT_325080 [Filobasidium floriforme]KAH8082223.1 hypothetical protein HD553DRAFT_325080 [Filobasidium floriforme]